MTLLERAALQGFPRLQLRQGIVVMAGEESWTKFTSAPPHLDHDLAEAALRKLEGAA